LSAYLLPYSAIFQQINRLFPWRANQRENCNENGTKSHIWGEIDYLGVKKIAGKSDYFGKSPIKIYFCRM